MLNCNENAFYGILVVIVGIFVFSSIKDLGIVLIMLKCGGYAGLYGFGGIVSK